MNFQTITTAETSEWKRTLCAFSPVDIYFQAEYHKAYEANGDGEAFAFIAQSDLGTLFYPFLMRHIVVAGDHETFRDYRDIETVYGYTGPLTSNSSPEFLAEAWAGFSDWCAAHKVVTEFVRFSPLLANTIAAAPNMRVELSRDTVLVPIADSPDELWRSYPSVQRNMVRKAISNGLQCRNQVITSDALSEFRTLYQSTMRRLGSAAYYDFSEEYYSNLVSGLGESLQLFMVNKSESFVAAALILVDESAIHYHLAGSNLEARQFGASNLLLHTVAEWGMARGLKVMHLGGGSTNSPADPLFKFKSSIGTGRAKFYTGKKVWDADAYLRIWQLWSGGEESSGLPDRLQFYRN